MKRVMGTYRGIISKSAALLGMLLMSIAFVHAQARQDVPAWTTSKDVQKIANKRMFNDDNLRKSHITANTVKPTWMITKAVHRVNKDEAVARNNVKSSGIPTWTISKGVQRIGRK
jgi:hypothetical protein